MSTTITFRRGTVAPTSGAGLTLGEPAFDTANRNLYIGLGSGVTAAWVGARISGSSGDIAAGLTNWIVNAKAVKDYVTNVAVAGSTTFATDISVNSLTVGRGPGDSGNLTNTAVGLGALAGNQTGSQFTVIGYAALSNITAGDQITAIGSRSLDSLDSGYLLASIGSNAFRSLVGGSGSVAIGPDAGWKYGGDTGILENASNSTFVGYKAQPSADGEDNQIVIGANAVGQGSNSTTIGTSATTLNRLFGTVWSNGGISAAGSTFSGDLNVNGLRVGRGPGNSITNVAIGTGSLASNSTGISNVAIGNSALDGVIAGSGNVGVGSVAIRSTVGSNNVGIGNAAGRYFGTGTSPNTGCTGSIFIGHESRASALNNTNEIVIGTQAVGMGSNTAVIGATTQSAAYIYGSLVPVGGISAAGITLTGNVTISGNFTVNGTTTTINTSTISVDDKNIVLADIASPTDVLADGGGITLLGDTPKLFVWERTVNSGTWTSSENLTLATGKAFYINTTQLLTEQGIVFVDGGTYT